MGGGPVGMLQDLQPTCCQPIHCGGLAALRLFKQSSRSKVFFEPKVGKIQCPFSAP